MSGADEADFGWVEDSEALSITCIRGLSEHEIIARLGYHPIGTKQQSLHDAYVGLLDQEGIDSGPGQVFEHDGWMVLVEQNGWRASLSQALALLSEAGVAANLFWNVNGLARFGYAVSGAVVRSFDLSGIDGSEGDPLPEEADLGFDDPDGRSLTSGMVLLQRMTGLVLSEDELLNQARQCYHPDAEAALAASRDPAEREKPAFPSPEELAELAELVRWRGLTPTERMRAVQARVPSLAHMDWELTERVIDLDSDRQRKVACWAARWSCQYAGVENQPEVARALEALDNGESLPAPFNDRRGAYDALRPGPKGGARTLTIRVSHGNEERTPIATWAAATDATLSAGKPDPAAAAIDALVSALAGQADLSAGLAQARDYVATLR